ncbi:rhomboid family intramembrane serine protease [uncultured Sphingomonas sp.]|uniref:rhomboid family intramembrane serine protease n=1 Tax=uncultured Sphingomonas sp. TaxID=158754 RepID=UPI0035CB72E8
MASVSVLLSGWLPYAAVMGGFIPERFAGLAMPEELGTAVPAVLTPLSATLIHGGVAHLLLNLLMLGFCGLATERAIGSAGLVVLYVAGAYAAAAGQWLIGGGGPMIGASGAISAIVAAYTLFYGQNRARRIGPVPGSLVHVAWLAAAWIGIQLLVGAVGIGGASIAVGAHIGGFLAGLTLARPLLSWRHRGA